MGSIYIRSVYLFIYLFIYLLTFIFICFIYLFFFGGGGGGGGGEMVVFCLYSFHACRCGPSLFSNANYLTILYLLDASMLELGLIYFLKRCFTILCFCVIKWETVEAIITCSAGSALDLHHIPNSTL